MSRGLAALGMFKPPVANSIRSAFRDILQYHKSKAKEAEKNVANADVLEAARNDPKDAQPFGTVPDSRYDQRDHEERVVDLGSKQSAHRPRRQR